jgi:hypothetical protein
MSISNTRLSGRLFILASQYKPHDDDEQYLNTHAKHVTLDNLQKKVWQYFLF